MKTKLVAAITLSALSLALMPANGYGRQDAPKADDAKVAAPAAEPATEDVVYMRDGRVLHGQIIVETSRGVTFEYHDKNLNIKTKLTLKPEEIVEIQRDLPLEGGAAAPEAQAEEEAAAPAAPAPGTAKKTDYKPSYGAARFQTTDTDVPSLYIVPMHGQFGTDVRADVYKPVIEDIRKSKPSMVIIDIKSADAFPPELMFPSGYDIPRTDPALERSMLEFETYRELVHMFRDELRDVKQVVWIHDSDGISATVSMAWDQMYMSPNARFGGLITVLEQSNADKHQDTDVRAKMMAAWLGFAKAFLEKGGYSQVLADAMLQKEKTLSGSWKGREIAWSLDTNGEYVVDDNDKRTVDFVAKTAEDLCISQGTAEDLDDLALLLGYREYRVIDGRQNDLTLGYVEDWRRAFAKCRKNLQDYQKHMEWATGDDAIKYLGKAKSNLEDVLQAMNTYKAVEIRIGTDFGLDKVRITTWIEQLKEQLRALQRRGGGGGAGGGGGGRAGGRSGGGERPG